MKKSKSLTRRSNRNTYSEKSTKYAIYFDYNPPTNIKIGVVYENRNKTLKSNNKPYGLIGYDNDDNY